MPLRDHWWCILVAKYGAFLFTEIGAVVITDYNLMMFAFYIIFQSYSDCFSMSPQSIKPRTGQVVCKMVSAPPLIFVKIIIIFFI
jgi:hypothetical protein